jgi:hypothetical protein
MIKRFLAACGLLFSFAAAAQTTSVTGTIKDLTNVAVTSGQVTFELKPSLDTTISGSARFSPSTVTCGINGSGAVKDQALSGTCTVVNNTSLSPSGTYYKVCIQPSFISPGSCFNWYALGTSTDITTVVPTPGTTPAFSFVDLFATQTITGQKTFSNTSNSFFGTLTGTHTSSTSNPAATGIIRLAKHRHGLLAEQRKFCGYMRIERYERFAELEWITCNHPLKRSFGVFCNYVCAIKGRAFG